jgi:hypothetical protein
MLDKVHLSISCVIIDNIGDFMDEKRFNLKEIFTQPKYRRMNPYQKEIFVTGLFHSKNFNQIRKEEHIVLLKELKEVLLKKYRCGPYTMIVLPSDYQLHEDLFDMVTDVYKRRIYIRKSFVEDGIIQNGYDDAYCLDFLNVYLLDCIYHEMYHIISRNQIMRKSTSYLDREFVEQLLWYLTIKHNENSSLMEQVAQIESTFLEEDILSYRMLPEEYYAHLFAYNQVNHAFKRNVVLYGEDKNLGKYQFDVEQEKSILVKQYNNIHKTNYTFDEIYEQVYLMNIICFSTKNEEEVREVYQKLGRKKHFIKR